MNRTTLLKLRNALLVGAAGAVLLAVDAYGVTTWLHAS